MRSYRESFDDGPGGWFGWNDNARGPKPLEQAPSCVISRSPWWIDYNHAPPGAGYMHLLFMLLTSGSPGEYQREVSGENRFVQGRFGTDFTNATVRLRLRGELITHATRLYLLCQGVHHGICTGWLLTGQPIEVTTNWTETRLTLTPDESAWTCLSSRHDRTDYYGSAPLQTVLRDTNADILLVLFPLEIVPMGPLNGDPNRLRPERDYPIWRSRLPEGYVEMDEVQIDFP
ncbi:MAG: hypothetical protein FJ295_21525 [Planctomycetes bacterium]|nr:hypothetical protein [Planctomycetota bacterium]